MRMCLSIFLVVESSARRRLLCRTKCISNVCDSDNSFVQIKVSHRKSVIREIFVKIKCYIESLHSRVRENQIRHQKYGIRESFVTIKNASSKYVC